MIRGDAFQEILLDDVSSHIFQHYVDFSDAESRDLGIVRKFDTLEVTIDGKDYSFEQSISNLNNSKSSTGFVLWRIAVPFIKWLLHHQDLFDLHDKYVVELGAGVSGLFSTMIGPSISSHYIATDQYHLLKLLKKNIKENLPLYHSVQSQTIDIASSAKKSKKIRSLDVATYDWEDIDRGIYEIQKVNPKEPDFMIACDVVYNDFLVPHLVESIKRLAGTDTKIIIGLQLRLPENVEYFVETLLKNSLRVWKIEESVLTEELRQGFLIYYIEKLPT